MRHHSNKRKFGREKNQRNALMSSLVRNLIRDGKIKTTTAKAKELRPMVEKLLTRAKKNTIGDRRLVDSKIKSATQTKRLFEVIGPKYIDRKGGYTRITKLPNRSQDGSQMSIIEFV